jgi:hypothetical protein
MNMSKGLRLSAALAAVVGLAASCAGPAAAQGGVQIGSLSCNASGTWGFIFGSTRELACTFSAPGRVEYYRGQISKFGVDIGYTSGGVLVWGVIAPTAQLRPGDLAGTFAGATASATIGVGLGANALIGGNGNSITLQPLSIEGTMGLNVAGGVASMTLVPAR